MTGISNIAYAKIGGPRPNRWKFQITNIDGLFPMALDHFKVEGDSPPILVRLCGHFLTANGVWACGGHHAVEHSGPAQLDHETGAVRQD